ncbi:hypothetical protein, partial [Thiogranum longum]
MVESALYMLTGIAFYGGAHQLILGVRQTPVHPHALHGVMYLLLSGFSLASALTYQSHSLSTLVPAGKLTVTMGILLWGLLAWFVAAYTQVRLRLVLVALTTAWTIHLIGNIGAPLSLMYSEINPVEQTLPSGQIQMSWQSTLSVWWHAVQLTILATLAYCVYAGLRLFRHGDKRAAAALACGLLVLLVTSITDLLVNVQAIELAFLTPFGFLALLVASSIYPGLQNRKTEEAESLPANYN